MSDEKDTTPDDATASTTAATEEPPASGEAIDDAERFEFVEDPSFDVAYKGECAYEVKVSVPAANEKKQAEELLEELKDGAELPGFRRGKAPRKLLERKFGKAIRADALNKLVTAAFEKLIENEKLVPIEAPDIDGLEEAMERDADAALEFTLKFEVAPRCKVGAFEGISIEKPVLTVGDDEINETLDTMRERFAVYSDAPKNAKIKDGDQAVIDFEGAIDGEPFEGGAAENYPYIIGSKRFFPEFEEALAGAKVGQELTATVQFPEDYGPEGLNGKTAEFRITVKEHKRKELPALDDDFAKQAGAEDLAALKERVASELRADVSSRSNEIAEARAVEALVGRSEFELPKSLVESSAKEYYDQEVRRLMALRVPGAELQERDEQIRKEAEETALRNIKALVVVNQVARDNDLEATEADFEAEAAAIGRRTGMEADVISRFLQQSDKRDDYESRIIRQKAIALLLEKIEIVEKEVTDEELDAQDENA